MTTDTVQAMPKTLSGVAPYLNLSDADAASKFYAKAFAGQEMLRKYADDGKRLLHVHLYINGASVMLSDPFPEWGAPMQSPQGFMLHLQVDDADAWFARAVEAGCTVKMAVDNMFWGDRYGMVVDPFGVVWTMGSTIRT